jgi:cellulose synthase/poly-beta-1,6-N-acetylglucosamine synthase-like glycosyltransferase
MLYEIGRYLWIIFQIIIGYNLIIPLLILCIYALKRSDKKNSNVKDFKGDYAIIVTAYEQTDFLPFVVESILKLNFKNYLIYIVADKCDISNLHFEDKRVILLRPESTLASNTRSHFYAIQRFKRDHNCLTIIDSDNLVHPDYLSEIEVFFERGYEAVQGVREAKNLNTNLASLDAARDMYYHFYDGKILFGAGSSATLAGSGMAFTTKLYKDCLEQQDVTGAGFDKVLQYEIVKRDLKIAFAERAIVYDEKTAAPDQLVKQRARWINTWFKYSRYGSAILTKGISNFSLNQLLFGIILLRPPLFIFLVLTCFCMCINIWVSSAALVLWSFGLFCFLLSFAIAIFRPGTDQRIYRSLINIPVFIFYQLISLFKSRTANKKSVATKHVYKSEF